MTKLNTPELTLSRLVFLTISSVLICLSFLLTILTPYPMALGLLLFGRKKGLVAILIGGILVSYTSLYVFKEIGFIVFYLVSAFISIGTIELLKRTINPVRIVLILGSILFLTMVGLTTVSVKQSGLNFENYIVSEFKKSSDLLSLQKKNIETKEGLSEETMQVLSLLDNPENMAKEVVKVIPSYAFMTIFLMLWVNVFLILKSQRLLPFSTERKFSEKVLLNFRMPDYCIWPVIGALVLAILGEEIHPSAVVVGTSILRCFGVFYFFQGLGIYIDFLDAIKLKGFLRTLLFVFTVVTANQVLAAIGLFDMFVNFRKYLMKMTRS